MKALLMYQDRDLDLSASSPPNETALIQDLELDALFGAMADGDEFLLDVARKVVLTSLDQPAEILYRQHVLADCLERPAVFRELYATAVEAIESEKKVWGGVFYERYPEALLSHSVQVLHSFVGLLRKLRRIADVHRATCRSEGVRTLFGMIATELGDEYLGSVEEHLSRLAFRDGVLVSARLGKGNTGADYVLRKASGAKPGWLQWLSSRVEERLPGERSGYVYQIPDRDEGGFRALSELRGRGISGVTSAAAQSADHVLSFFSMLRLELAFYVGCLNLRDRLARKGEPICFPEPSSAGEASLSCRGLYDIALSLSVKDRVVGNDVSADGKRLVMVTGANQGGKSTFLRSAGQAQLLMQCGMFVPAESYRANVCRGIFTHYKREEDKTMKSGKLDEELARISWIVDRLTPNSLLLLNESFGSTNEREGSEIARQIVRALLEAGVKVLYVTHLFDLAQGFRLAKMDAALFLRAERLADGRRTFRLVEGGPLPTSFGEDLYGRIFGPVDDAAAPTPRA